MQKRVVARCGSIPRLDDLLSRHPGVDFAGRSGLNGIEFKQGDWQRRVLLGEPKTELRGLVELMDNNPLVCANEASVPSASATLVLIALGPMIRAGILERKPKATFNFEASEAEMLAYVRPIGWESGVSVASGGIKSDSVLSCEATVSVAGHNTTDEIESLYDHAYGHAFYVRRSEESDWDSSLVFGRPYALYRVRANPGDRPEKITLQVLADRDGKCGAAQLVHCMNVMAGFEESLGIGESIR